MSIGDRIKGDLTSQGQVSDTFWPAIRTADVNMGAFNVWISGPFVGSCNLQRTPDNGVTWYDLVTLGVKMNVYTVPGSETVQEAQAGMGYRIICTALASGTIHYDVG